MNNSRVAREENATVLRIIRELAGVQPHVKVRVIQGEDAPVADGEGPYWTTSEKSTTRVRFPNAYSRNFGRPYYHATTRIVLVGEDYLQAVRSLVRVAALSDGVQYLQACGV